MMRPGIDLRQARSDDARPISRLIDALGYRAPSRTQIVRSLSAIQDAGGEVWLAESEPAGPVGLLSLLFLPVLREGGVAARVEELVVREDWRGRGIGTALLARAEQRALERGALYIELYTARSRPNYARGFYAGRGFEELDAALFRRWLVATSSRQEG